MSSITARMSPPAVTLDGRASLRPLAVADSAKTLMAALAAGAGVIHLAMVPSHMDEWAFEGVVFAVAGWLQLAIAVLLFARPARLLVIGTIPISIALIGAWALSRTAGFPFGPHAGHPESVSFIDLSAVGFEAALIVIAATLLVRPALARGWRPLDLVIAPIAMLGVLALTTAALASPSARDHAAHSHGDHNAMVDDKGLSLLTNGHHHAIVQQKLDPETQATLDGQLAVTREIARRYPTIADAEAGGYRRAGPYVPGIGAHYVRYGGEEFNIDGVVEGADLQHPLAIIYDGTDAGSPVAGFMFYSMSKEEPKGFAGPNDVWHYHQNICLARGIDGEVEAPLGADSTATAAQCAAAGGDLLPVTQWMLHVWTAPGYDKVDDGVFAEVNPALDCPDGTYYQRPPEEWSRNLRSSCRSTTP